MRFEYLAVNEAGKRITGQINGTESEVIDFIIARGWTLVELRPQATSQKLKQLQLNDQDLETVFSRLAYLTANGVKVDRAMTLLARASLPDNIKYMVEDLSLKMNEGQSLHQALDDYDQHVDKIFLAGIKLGEKIGSLDTTFDFIARSLSRRIRLRKDIQKATIYPAAILVFSVLSLFFIFNFIVPRITGIFRDAAELPWYTRTLMQASDFTIHYQYHLLAGFAASAAIMYWMAQQPEYRQKLVHAAYQLPVINRFLIQADQIRFCNAMSLALNSGLQIQEALLNAADTVISPSSRQSLLNAADNIGQGQDAATALVNAHFLSDFHASLLEVSQDKRALGNAFTDIGDRLADELNDNIGRVLVLMEPALIGIMGIIIGSIVLVMMLSILSIQNIGL